MLNLPIDQPKSASYQVYETNSKLSGCQSFQKEIQTWLGKVKIIKIQKKVNQVNLLTKTVAVNFFVDLLYFVGVS